MKQIRAQNLLNRVQQCGDQIVTGLQDLETRFPQFFSSARGLGTICAVDAPSEAVR